jgi:ribulose-5-phosphate 4-epimerase/fuculose-1-phosphate aldolase
MEQAPELKEILQHFYQGFASGDPSAFERLMSRHEGILAIGTDPNEWWDNLETLTRVTRAQLQEMRAAGMSIVPGDAQCYREGSVGWIADRPSFRLADGSEISTRVTMVLHQEDGEWKAVQFHTSIGVPNQDVAGVDLTTE